MSLTRGNITSLISKIAKNTPGTGMRDDVPAMIKLAKGGQPAALSEGEYVIPADIVSMLGDGNSEAGAKILQQFIKEIRKKKGKHLARGKQAPQLHTMLK